MFGDILGMESPQYKKVRDFIDIYPSGKVIDAHFVSGKTNVNLRSVRLFLEEMRKANYLFVFSQGYLKGNKVCNTLYIKN